jgi:glyceraldehyde-3-phosphate dehydrogenase (NADP+)
MSGRQKEVSEIFKGFQGWGSRPYGEIPHLDQRTYLVGGELRNWTGEVTKVFSPICYEDGNRIELGSYPNQTAQDALKALEAAETAYNKGQGAWPSMSLAMRIECMQNFVRLIKEQRDIVAQFLRWEICKNVYDAEKEFDRTVEYIEKTIEAAKEMDHNASKLSVEEGIIAQIRRSPLGVVLCMGPQNYPINELITLIVPALLAGNVVIFKPAKYGVLLFASLLEAFQEAFPAGVVNSIYGDGKVIIGPLMASGKIDVLAFIGSSKVANLLKKQHPYPNRLKCVLGLDAKNPGIVMADADIELAVKECVLGALSFNGQRCTALKVLFVHKSILGQFTTKFVEAVEKLNIGSPNVMMAPTITPLAEEGKVDWLKGLIKDAEEKGAKVINPSGGLSNGTFMFPAVVCPVTPEMRLYREEQFGPVVPIVPYEDPSEMLRYVLESNFGQQVSIFGEDSFKIGKLIDSLSTQVSRININCQCQRGPDSFPFTGRKDSAEGTLSITDALKVFSIRAMVATKATDQNKAIITRILRNRQSQFLSRDFIL